MNACVFWSHNEMRDVVVGVESPLLDQALSTCPLEQEAPNLEAKTRHSDMMQL